MDLQELTENEEAVLLIAAEGGNVAPIGMWKEPVENLALRGILYRQDAFNYLPTGKGREIIVDLVKRTDARTDAALGALIERGSVIGTAQKRIVDFAEQAAQLLAASALASEKVTGDAPEAAARNWAEVILKRALALLREKR